MNEKGVSYPSVMIDPGSYGGRIFMNGRALPGTIELQADSVVTAEFYDEEAFKKPGGYPQDSQLDQLVGQLWQNHHVVLRGVQLMEVFPGRYVARAKYALVGLNPEAIEGSFTRMEVQVEGLNEFFYAPPLAEFSWSHQTPGEFAATTAEGTEASWSSDGLDISAGYPWNIEHQEGYRLHVSFVPALEANSGESLSPDDWIRLWLRPLTRLISFSTGAIRRPTWVMFSNNADPPEWVPRAQLFGSG